MARSYYTEDQLAAQRAAGAQVPDGSGRIVKNGVVISAADRASSALTRERDNELAMQAGAPPTAQGPVGGSMLPRPQAMSGDVNSYNGSRYDRNFAANNNLTASAQPTRYQGNNRQLNVERAKADGQFDSMRTQFNLANRDRQMDDMGTILPVPQANTQPAQTATPSAPAAPRPNAAMANNADMPAPQPQAELPRPVQPTGPFELTYQKANGKFYGETRDGRGQVFDTQEQASAFSRGQAQQSQPAAPAPQQVAAQPPQFVPTPEQERVLQQPVGSAAGRAFGVVPQAPAAAAPAPVPVVIPPTQPVATPVNTPAPAAPKPQAFSVVPGSGTSGPGIVEAAQTNPDANRARIIDTVRGVGGVFQPSNWSMEGGALVFGNTPAYAQRLENRAAALESAGVQAPGYRKEAKAVQRNQPLPRQGDPYAERVAMRRAQKQAPKVPLITPPTAEALSPNRDAGAPRVPRFEDTEPAAFPTLPGASGSSRPRATFA